MSPSTSDFSQILELQEFRRLYEEQEEKIKVRMRQKDEEIGRLRGEIENRDARLQELADELQQAAEDRDRMKADYQRLRQEAHEKIDKLMERIKELNQRIMGDEKKSGIFR